jgi:uncharacterized membrane protein YccC
MAPLASSSWRSPLKSLIGSAVFLVSLFVMRRILVEAGVMTPDLALVFLACVVGIPLGGIVFLEGAIERESQDLRREIDSLRAEIAALRESTPPKDV